MTEGLCRPLDIFQRSALTFGHHPWKAACLMVLGPSGSSKADLLEVVAARRATSHFLGVTTRNWKKQDCERRYDHYNDQEFEKSGSLVPTAANLWYRHNRTAVPKSVYGFSPPARMV